ncbi:MAG: tail protein X [Peptococcaceae bacterium]|nr:tail protein X [Peptococcaceae bacterium]
MPSPTISGYTTYRTVEGDTFDLIALMQYNDEKMAHHIITANPDYCDILIFDACVELQLPVFSSPTPSSTLPPWRRGE